MRAWPDDCIPVRDDVYCREHFSRRYPLELIIAGLLAFIAGVSFGIFGAGGSTLLVPILVYVLHLPVRVALGMALLILVFTGIVAAQAHGRSGNTHWKIGLQWSALGIAGAYLGGRVAGFIPPVVLMSVFAGVIILSSVAMLRGPAPPRTDETGTAGSPSLWKTSIVGFALGLFTGVIGMGGGFLLVPALVLLCRIDVKKAIGTSLLIISINSVGGFLGFTAHTEFPITLTATITGFSALGSLVGERVSKPLPSHRLRPAFAIFLLVLGALIAVRNVLDAVSGMAP